MNCPSCGGDTTVKDSRPVSDPERNMVRRRRECEKGCGRFTTFEIVFQADTQIITQLMPRLRRRRFEAEIALQHMQDDLDAYGQLFGEEE